MVWRHLLGALRRRQALVEVADKFVDQLAAHTENGVPSLINCTQLTVEGKVEMAEGRRHLGTVKFVNTGDEVKLAPDRAYTDETVEA